MALLREKVLNAFTGAWLMARGGEDYDECFACMEELVEIEEASSIQEAFEIVLNHLRTFGAHIVFNEEEFIKEMYIAHARKYGIGAESLIDSEWMHEWMEETPPYFDLNAIHFHVRTLDEHQVVWLLAQMENKGVLDRVDVITDIGHNPIGLAVDTVDALHVMTGFIIAQRERRVKERRASPKYD